MEKLSFIAENLVEKINQLSNWSYIIARIFSMHDSNQTGSFLRPNLERRFISEDLTKPFKLEGGESKRDFLGLREKVAELLVQLAFSNAVGTFNIASGRPMTVSDFARTLTLRKFEHYTQGKSKRPLCRHY